MAKVWQSTQGKWKEIVQGQMKLLLSDVKRLGKSGKQEFNGVNEQLHDLFLSKVWSFWGKSKANNYFE